MTKEILSCFDAFVLSDVLSGIQCDILVEKSEQLNKYSPWNQQREKARKDFRDADTVCQEFSDGLSQSID